MTKTQHACPQCGDPECSPPDHKIAGVPSWALAFALIMALGVALVTYTFAQR